MTLADDTSVSLTLDLKGMLCPMPVVEISRAIKQVEVGQIVEATATDPGVMADIPAWCHSTGNTLMALEKAESHFVFRVRRDA
ncbi:MAG: sulfurtransferase TusA family protein [bacterium]|nr:sulfurtransferase TusA family protein [bacterium]